MGEAPAHGALALLEERRGEAALSEGSEGPCGIVAEDDHGVRAVEFEGGRVESEDTGEGLLADLVTHVVRVRQGADDDLALTVGPPAEDHAPAVQGGVPGDDGDVGIAGIAREKTPRINTAASETAGGREMVRSESSSPSVPRTEEKRATNGRTDGRHAE